MKPISVIVADDDQLIIEDLKTLIDWEKLGFNLVATAQNGSQALKRLKKYRPQVLITDIIMPGMDGLELIRQARQLLPGLRILIITSYDEFDYAKRALQLGVTDYILKNEITSISLAGKLLDIASTIEESTRISESFLRQELSGYFKETNRNPSLPASIGSLKDEQYYFFVAAQCTPFTLNMEQAAYLLSASLDYLSYVLAQFTTLSLPVQFSNEKFLIFTVRIETSQQERRFLLSSVLRQLWQRFSSAFNQPCILFYYPHRITIEGFRKIYQDTLPVLRYTSAMFCEIEPINMESLSTGENYVPLNRTFPFHQLTASKEQAEEQILKIRHYLVLCKQSRDIATIMDFYRGFCIHMENISYGQFPANKLRYFYSFESFLKWTFNTYQDCITLKNSDSHKQFSTAVRTAVEYMQENYSNYALTAEMISEAAHLSASRLGVLFKQETNRTINEYLTELRIEQAIYFLKNTNMKIYEISEKCGYKSSQYFSQVFCSHTGKRPIDYRKT